MTSHCCVRMTHIWRIRSWVPVARFSYFDPLRLGLNIESAHGRSLPPIFNALKAITEPVQREKRRVYCLPTSIQLNLKRRAIGDQRRKRSFATYVLDAPLGPDISFRCPVCSMREPVRLLMRFVESVSPYKASIRVKSLPPTDTPTCLLV